MSDELVTRNQLDRFIRDELHTVPQLEALLLFWRHFPAHWTCEQLARQLYVPPETCQDILNHLAERHHILKLSDSELQYALHLDSPQKKQLLASLEYIYRHELIRVSKMIHANASPGLRDFARSFRFKKD